VVVFRLKNKQKSYENQQITQNISEEKDKNMNLPLNLPFHTYHLLLCEHMQQDCAFSYPALLEDLVLGRLPEP
jgi:hypothetical protein